MTFMESARECYWFLPTWKQIWSFMISDAVDVMSLMAIAGWLVIGVYLGSEVVK